MEATEVKNYTKYLDRSRVVGMKTHLFIALSFSCLIFFIYVGYAFAFYIGSIWIQREYWNDAQSRPYGGGDVLAVFFGVVFGFFAIGQSATANQVF